MNDFNIHKSCPEFFYAFKRISTTFLYFLSGCLTFLILFQRTQLLAASEINQVPNQIIVKYKETRFSPLANITNDTNQDYLATESADYNYTAIFPERRDVVLIEGDNIEQLIEKLKNDTNVEYLEPHFIKQVYDISVQRNDLPNDNDFNKQWALNNSSSELGSDIDFIEAIALSRESTADNPLIIGIIDSTFEINHPDLVNQLWVNQEEIPNNGIDDDNNGYIDDIHGFNFENLSPNIRGSDDHGTHVAGICAAQSNNKLGISGVFPNVKFIALACSAGGDSISTIATIRAKEYVIELKNRGYNIVAVNASYGGNYYSQIEYESIKNLANSEILFCAAAGNNGWDLDIETNPYNSNVYPSDGDVNGNGILEVSYPSSYNLPNIISVASIDSNQQLAFTSNYGFREVDIAAPGESIFSTVRGELISEIQDIKLSNGMTIPNQLIEFSSDILENELSGSIIACGLGDIGDFPSEVNGNIALIKRGSLYFSDKVTNAMNAGAIATIIYNNIEENPDGIRPWTLGSMEDVAWIPSFSISQSDGEYLLEELPLIANLKPFIDTLSPNSIQYSYLSGTSMATPIATAAVAFSAHNFPNENMAQRRTRILDNVQLLPTLKNKIVSGGVINLRKIVDSDEDKLPDWWEIENFDTLVYTNTQDNDNDGYSNRDEFLSKTDPLNKNNLPKFKTNLNVSNLSLTISDALGFEFVTHQGYNYTIQTLASLSENIWVDVTQINITGDGIPFKVIIDDIDSSNKDKQFYRLKATSE